jgi:hypothetical protein
MHLSAVVLSVALGFFPAAPVYATDATPPQINLVAGWNLVGNSTGAPLSVSTVLGNAKQVSTVWKWLASSSRWSIYTPARVKVLVA